MPRLQLDGSIESMKTTYSEPSANSSSGPNELVSWVRFIEALHVSSGETMRKMMPVKLSSNEKHLWTRIEGFVLPDLKIQQHSWDFVPPEVVRPLAVVGISDIAILARRLGMIWNQFDPSEGNMKAEGNGHMISSTIVRSMGTVLQIGIKDPLRVSHEYKQEDINELYIPSNIADKMGFGILTGDSRLGLPDYKLGTEAEVLATLRNHVDVQAADTVKSIVEANPGWTPGISDIIGFASPMIRVNGSSFVRVPQPAGFAIGLTHEEPGFVVFFNRLKDLLAERDAKSQPVSVQTRSILHQYEELREKYGNQWEDHRICNQRLNDRDVAFMEDLHRRHDSATEYFVNLSSQSGDGKWMSQPFNYADLMYSHIKFAVNYFPDAVERINASPSRARNHYGLRVPGWLAEGAHIYFDNIPKVAKEMEARGFRSVPKVIEEAWLTMMWKGFLWHRCHFMVEGARVPSAHYGSKLPVYIG
ncbi:MAG: hypothetical protein Q9191_003213 [Dirinaria sp. TL-2023a]